MPPIKPRISLHHMSHKDLLTQAGPVPSLLGLCLRSLKMEHKLLPHPKGIGEKFHTGLVLML